jgi:hypothetical protein
MSFASRATAVKAMDNIGGCRQGGPVTSPDASVDPDEPADTVRGLRLPQLLLDLIADGRWRQPDDDALAAAVPWFEDPLDLLTDVAAIRRQSRSLDDLGGEDLGPLFRQTPGSTAAAAVELPWLDTEQAVLLAVCRHAGDDVAIALDYRTGPDGPRVVGSDIWTDPRAYTWRVAAPSVPAFAAALGLLS